MIPSESFEGRTFKPEVDITIKRCASCGDVLSDQEIRHYGLTRSALYFGDLFKGFCAFCYNADELEIGYGVPVRKSRVLLWRVFKNSDYQIFTLKCKIRDVIYNSPKVKQLERHLKNLYENHYAVIFPQKYSEEKSWYRDDWDNTSEEIEDQKRIPRNSFNNCLGKFGSLSSDDAPTVRNITARNKRSLVKALKKELEIVERKYRSGQYD